MAPRRGRTLDAFLTLCQQAAKFDVNLREEFDQDVTSSHSQVLLIIREKHSSICVVERCQSLTKVCFICVIIETPPPEQQQGGALQSGP